MKSVFGLEALRPGQDKVIESVLAGRHTLAIMPTGAGKSLCYQLPAVLLPGMTIVVSPRIALMKDQYDKMQDLGLAAPQINSAVPTAEQVEQPRAALRHAGIARCVLPGGRARRRTGRLRGR